MNRIQETFIYIFFGMIWKPSQKLHGIDTVTHMVNIKVPYLNVWIVSLISVIAPDKALLLPKTVDLFFLISP